jgi:hypothetical protein
MTSFSGKFLNFLLTIVRRVKHVLCQTYEGDGEKVLSNQRLNLTQCNFVPLYRTDTVTAYRVGLREL